MPSIPIAEDFDAIRRGLARLEAEDSVSAAAFSPADEQPIHPPMHTPKEQLGRLDLIGAAFLAQALVQRALLPVSRGRGMVAPKGPNLLASALANVACWARDVHGSAITSDTLRRHSQLFYLVDAAGINMHPDMPQKVRAAVQSYLVGLPGYQPNYGGKQPIAAWSQHDANARSLQLAALTDKDVLDAVEGELVKRDAVMRCLAALDFEDEGPVGVCPKPEPDKMPSASDWDATRLSMLRTCI